MVVNTYCNHGWLARNEIRRAWSKLSRSGLSISRGVVISMAAPKIEVMNALHRLQCLWPIRMGRFWWTGVQLV